MLVEIRVAGIAFRDSLEPEIFMSFILFLLKETTPLKVALAVSVLVVISSILPTDYENELPVGPQWIFFAAIFIILVLVGFGIALVEEKKSFSSKSSPVFSQAASAVISLGILLLPIYLLRPALFALAFLMFVVESGLVFGKYLRIRATGVGPDHNH